MSITVEIDGAVAIVTINAPETRNALTLEMRKDLLQAFQSFAEDQAVRAVVLTGAGEAFCAGADVRAMGGRGLAESRQRMRHMHALIKAIHGLDKPVVAAVRGPVAGMGWSLALACDVVLAGESARFTQAFTRIGLAPDAGAIWFLARQLGMARARELVFSCRAVPAAEAQALGLVHRVLPDAELAQAAVAQAQVYAKAPTFALGMAKQLFAASVSPSLDQYLDAELLVQPQLMQTEDHVEGRTAFKEKRQPTFNGR